MPLPAFLVVVCAAWILVGCDITPDLNGDDSDASDSSFEAVVQAPTSVDTLKGFVVARPYQYVLGWTDTEGLSRLDTLRSTRLLFTLLPDDSTSLVFTIVLPDEEPNVGVYRQGISLPGEPPRRFSAFYTPDAVCQYTRTSGTTEIETVNRRIVIGQFDFEMRAVKTVENGTAVSSCPGISQRIQVAGLFSAAIVR